MLPILNSAAAQRSKKYTVAFRGINYGEGYQDGEFSETENVSAAQYPCLSQRYARITEGSYNAPTSMHAKEGLLVVDGTGTVWYDKSVVGAVTPGRKQMATVGNYIVIFPDKVYYNVASREWGSMEAEYTASGLKFTNKTIETTGADWPFREGDAVTISGCSTAANNQEIIIRGVDGKKLTFYENSFTEATESVAVTIKRAIPTLTHICENNYRLWGTLGNTIYASKYMDPLNFNYKDQVASDSYAIDVATDGEFTGCIPFSSHICFFKENTLHKLYGTLPSNFQIVTSNIYGVQAGSERSMCIVNETLFYKGVLGVYAYNGGIPEPLSKPFGTRRYKNACAATDGSRYYISMEDEDGSWGVYAYDIEKNIWVREDGLHCVDMATHDGYVYLLGADGGLRKIDEAGDVSDLNWSATFCPFNETQNERKGYSKFHLRLDMAAGAWLKVEVKRDTDKRWEQVYTTHNEKAQTVSIPILPARCDSVEIRLSGKGECKLRTFVREFFTGSDRQ